MESTTKSPEMADAVERILESAQDKRMAELFQDESWYETAWDKAVQAGLDIANLIRKGEPAPPEMPDTVEQFLAAYPEGATVESIRKEEVAKAEGSD